MSDEIKFADGVWFYLPTPAQSKFMHGRLGIARERFANWLLDDCEGDYVNLKIMHSKKGGDPWIMVDDFMPTEADKPSMAPQQPPEIDDDDIPF